MQLAIATALMACVAGSIPAPAADSRSPLDDVIDSFFHLKQLGEVSIAPDGRHVAWVQSAEDPVSGSVTESVYVKDLENAGASARLVTAAEGTPATHEHDIAWSPNGKSLAFLSDAGGAGQLQLYVADVSGADVKNGTPRKLTGLKGSLGHPSWSPDGKSIAILFIENAARTPGPLEAETVETGVIDQQIFIQRLTLVDVDSGKVRQISPADLYIHEYDWSPDSGSFTATAAPGPGDNNWYIAQLYTINAATGKTASILKTSMQMANPRWSPDGRSVAFIGGLMSDEGLNGGDIFVVPAAGGGQPRNLTPHRKASPKWLKWLPSNRILSLENVDGAVAVTSLDPASGETKTLWTEESALSLSVTPDMKKSAAIRDSFERPPEIWAGAIGEWKQATHVNSELRASWTPSRSIHWNNEGYRVQGWLVYPRGFEASRRYPLIVAVHGGPAGMLTSQWPPSWNYETFLAAAGYFVFYPNPRGSMGQGEEFTRANVRDFGYGDLRDILAGVNEVLKTAPVDPDRIGITGWSYGGFMSMWAITQTQLFRAAVAGAGLANWQSYYGQNQIDQWLIPYFGASVYDDPSVYARSSPITYIKNVKTPTLILVGERDGECPLPQSYEYWHALKALGVETQFVVYPNEGHRISKPEHRRDIIRRAIGWFDVHLK